MIERQVIATWYTPEEKMPPEFYTVLATISGKAENATYDHALALLEWADDGQGWLPVEAEFDELIVHAWCDIEPYGGKR